MSRAGSSRAARSSDQPGRLRSARRTARLSCAVGLWNCVGDKRGGEARGSKGTQTRAVISAQHTYDCHWGRVVPTPPLRPPHILVSDPPALACPPDASSACEIGRRPRKLSRQNRRFDVEMGVLCPLVLRCRREGEGCCRASVGSLNHRTATA